MSKIVFDIGGTSMRVASVVDDTLVNIKKVATPQDPEEGSLLLQKIITEIAGGSEIESIVGGVPGIIGERGQLLKLPNLKKWEEYDLIGSLQKGGCPDVRIYNDSLLAGLGEARYGSGKGYSVVGYIGVGTGVGGAKIVDGKIGTERFAPGHQIINSELGTTLEDVASGQALFKKFGATPAEIDKSVFDERTLDLAAGIYNVLLLWSPEVLVLGGSLINNDRFETNRIIEELEKLNTTLPKLPDVRKALFGDDAGLHGARALLDN